jgi:hypothetical protein
MDRTKAALSNAGTNISGYVQQKAIIPGGKLEDKTKYFTSTSTLIPFIIVMFLNILSVIVAILSIFSSTGDNDQSGYNRFRLISDGLSLLIMGAMVIVSFFAYTDSAFKKIWAKGAGKGTFMIFLFIWLFVQIVIVVFDVLRYTESVEIESTGQLDLIELLDFSSTIFNFVLFTFLTVGAFMDNGLGL